MNDFLLYVEMESIITSCLGSGSPSQTNSFAMLNLEANFTEKLASCLIA